MVARHGTHLTHCGFGENFRCCKYGDDDCPALRPDSEAAKADASLKLRWMREVAAGATESGLYSWARENGDDVWRVMMIRIYQSLEPPV